VVKSESIEQPTEPRRSNRKRNSDTSLKDANNPTEGTSVPRKNCPRKREKKINSKLESLTSQEKSINNDVITVQEEFRLTTEELGNLHPHIVETNGGLKIIIPMPTPRQHFSI